MKAIPATAFSFLPATDKRDAASAALAFALLLLVGCSSSGPALGTGGGTAGRAGGPSGGAPGSAGGTAGGTASGTAGWMGSGGLSAAGGGGAAAAGGTGAGGAAGAGGQSVAAGQNGNAGGAGAGGSGHGGGPPAAAGAGGSVATAGGASGTAGAGGGGPIHDRCVDPLHLQLVDGQVAVSDDIKRATDEFPGLTCGGTSVEPLKGGQFYYRFTARPGMTYELRLKIPGFEATTFYVFPATAACTVDAIRTACTSGGTTGTRPTSWSSTALTPFAPRDPGDYIVAVDTISMPSNGTFTLTIFEYCGSAGGGGCKVKACNADLDQTCSGNVRSACNADGTAIVTKDCAATGDTCAKGTCVASVLDNFGYSGWSAGEDKAVGAGGVTLLDFFDVTTGRTLTEIDAQMSQRATVAIEWRVLEATSRTGPYQLIFSKETEATGTTSTLNAGTGPIQVPLVAGRFYAIGVALPAGSTYQLAQPAEKTLPMDLFFGRVTAAAVVPSASSSVSVDYPTSGTFVMAQRLFTTL